MFCRVIVPLDGSQVAECVLPYVGRLAREGCVHDVTFLSVVTNVESWEMLGYGQGFAGIAVYGDSLEEAGIRQAQEYLERIKDRLPFDGLRVDTAVVTGTAASAIVDYANKRAADLILIGTNGYTGMKRLVLGSVVQQVVREAQCPVLLVRPSFC